MQKSSSHSKKKNCHEKSPCICKGPPGLDGPAGSSGVPGTPGQPGDFTGNMQHWTAANIVPEFDGVNSNIILLTSGSEATNATFNGTSFTISSASIGMFYQLPVPASLVTFQATALVQSTDLSVGDTITVHCGLFTTTPPSLTYTLLSPATQLNLAPTVTSTTPNNTYLEARSDVALPGTPVSTSVIYTVGVWITSTNVSQGGAEVGLKFTATVRWV